MAQPVNMLTARPEGLAFDHWDLCGRKRENNSKKLFCDFNLCTVASV